MLKHIRVEAFIAAPPDTVFQALTQSSQLTQWFAEYAAVDLQAKRYDFWGRFTPDAPDRTAGRHPLLAWTPNRRLQYDWRLRGSDTRVDIELAPTDDGTAVTVAHDGVPARQDGQGSIADFWALALENLRSYVERGVVGLQCDFSLEPHAEVQLAVDIDAPASAVFNLLMEPDQLERYIATHATIEPHVGGRYDFGWDDGPSKILELKPNVKLTYSWHYPGEPDTVVSWSLEESDGRTRLLLVHSGFGADRLSDDYNLGWGAFLNQMKALAETGDHWQKVKTNEADYALA